MNILKREVLRHLDYGYLWDCGASVNLFNIDPTLLFRCWIYSAHRGVSPYQAGKSWRKHRRVFTEYLLHF